MAERRLHDRQRGAAIDGVGAMGVAQPVHRHGLVDPGRLRDPFDQRGHGPLRKAELVSPFAVAARGLEHRRRRRQVGAFGLEHSYRCAHRQRQQDLAARN